VLFFLCKTSKANMSQVRFERFTSNAKTPVKSTSGSVGFDLFSAYEYLVPAYGSSLILTDISIKMPNGVYGRIAPRSGLAVMYGLNVGGGVIGNFDQLISNKIYLM